jgi:hypothetical protein
MPRRQLDPEEAKLKRQQRNQRYRANLATKQHIREHDKLYRWNKRQQARLSQHHDQLVDIVPQQQYLERENDRIDEALIIGPVREREIVDVDDMSEHDEGLGNFDYDHEDEGFPDEVESEMSDYDHDDHGDGGFPDEVDSELSDDDDDRDVESAYEVESMDDDDDDQSDGGFPDEVELDMSDHGSKSVINH